MCTVEVMSCLAITVTYCCSTTNLNVVYIVKKISKKNVNKIYLIVVEQRDFSPLLCNYLQHQGFDVQSCLKLLYIDDSVNIHGEHIVKSDNFRLVCNIASSLQYSYMLLLQLFV